MPLYVFKNTETDEVFEEIMPYEKRVEFLKDNPHIICPPQAPRIVSGVATEIKIDGGFKEVLQRTAAQNPTSPLAATYGDKGIKATKTREVLQKHWGKKSD
jgi:hypothetical protein